MNHQGKVTSLDWEGRNLLSFLVDEEYDPNRYQFIKSIYWVCERLGEAIASDRDELGRGIQAAKRNCLQERRQS